MKRHFLFLALAIFIIPLVSSAVNLDVPLPSDLGQSFGTFKANTNISLVQECSNETSPCDQCNITSFVFPSGLATINNVAMTQKVTLFNYTLDSQYTGQSGKHAITGFCIGGGIWSPFAYTFEITPSGEVRPEGITIAFFALLFMLLIGLLSYIIIDSIGHAITLDFDIKNLAFNYGVYFVVVAYHYLQFHYVGSSFIISITEWMIDIGAVTQIFLPTIYFILTLTIGSWMQQRVKGVDY